MKTVVMDSQMFSSFQQCSCQFDLKFNQDLVPKGNSEAIEEGDLVHHILEPYYTLIKDGKNYKDAAHEAIIAGRQHTMTLELDIPESEHVIECFEQYVDRWGKEEFEILEVETPFAIKLYESIEEGFRFIYTGKIDLTVSTKSDPILIMDHKKRWQNRKIAFNSNQFIGYCIATKTNH